MSPRLVWAEGRLAKRRVRGKSRWYAARTWAYALEFLALVHPKPSPAHDARDILEERGVLMGKTLVAVAEDPPEASRVKGFYISCHSFTGNTSCPQALRFESRRPSATRFKPTPAAG